MAVSVEKILSELRHTDLKRVVVTATLNERGELATVKGMEAKFRAVEQAASDWDSSVTALAISKEQRNDDGTEIGSTQRFVVKRASTCDELVRELEAATNADKRFGVRVDPVARLRSGEEDFAPGTFRGRTWLRGCIENFIATEAKGIFVLEAPEGFGKTHFCVDLVDRTEGRCGTAERAACSVPLSGWAFMVRSHHALKDDPEAVLADLVRTARHRLNLPRLNADRVPVPIPDRIGRDDFRGFLTDLGDAAESGKRKAVLLVDGLDERFWGELNAGEWLPGIWPNSVYLILAGRPLAQQRAGWDSSEKRPLLWLSCLDPGTTAADGSEPVNWRDANALDVEEYVRERLAETRGNTPGAASTETLVRNIAMGCGGYMSHVVELFSSKSPHEIMETRLRNWAASPETIPKHRSLAPAAAGPPAAATPRGGVFAMYRSWWMGMLAAIAVGLGTHAILRSTLQPLTPDALFESFDTHAAWSVQLQPDRPEYRIGIDGIRFRLQTERAGYFHLLMVGSGGAEDEIRVLWDNSKVDTSLHVIPPGIDPLIAQGPPGETRLLAVVTPAPVDWKAVATGRSGLHWVIRTSGGFAQVDNLRRQFGCPEGRATIDPSGCAVTPIGYGASGVVRLREVAAYETPVRSSAQRATGSVDSPGATVSPPPADRAGGARPRGDDGDVAHVWTPMPESIRKVWEMGAGKNSIIPGAPMAEPAPSTEAPTSRLAPAAEPATDTRAGTTASGDGSGRDAGSNATRESAADDFARRSAKTVEGMHRDPRNTTDGDKRGVYTLVP